MDFTLDTEQQALRDAARALAARYAPDHGAAGATVGRAPHDPTLWSALAELGALGLPFPEEAGGFGASPVESGLVATELGRAGVQTAYAEVLVAGALCAAGGDRALLSSVAEGSALVVPALSETGRAWAPTATTVRAVRAGGSWSLTGAKSPVFDGAALTHALVTAGTDDGVAVFVVDSPTIDTAGSLVLDATPARLLVGPDRTTDAVERALSLGIVTLAAEAVGAMDAALSLTSDYLKTRKQFGVPLMSFQTLTQRAADMYVSVELARSTALFGAMTLADAPDDTMTASRVKVVLGQTGRHVGQEAIQLHGGIGMTAEYAVGHLTTRLTAIEHTFGDTRFHLARLASTVADHDVVDVLG